MRIRATRYDTGQRIDIVVESGQIVEQTPAGNEPADHESQWVAPAFFDLQINGCHGHSFNSELLNFEKIQEIVRVCHSHGISELCPTLITNSFEAIRHGFNTLRQAREQDSSLAQALPGYHLEGPYISPEDGPRGAHPKEHVRPPDWDEFCRWQEAAGGKILLVTLAPEWPQATDFIERLVDSGIVVALAHTAASAEQLSDAVKAGARLSTHLGNGSHALLPRHDNYIWHQLANDTLFASLITDGHHLPASVVKCMMRVKTPERVVITCDASSLAGLPPGTYREWGQEFEVCANGKVLVAGTSYLGGSGLFTDVCVSNAMTFAGVSLRDAIDMAGAGPRALLGLPERTLAVGQRADLVLFDKEENGPIQWRKTFVGGTAYNP